MADRLNYFFRQAVKEAELDLGFELLERADRNLAADVGIHGIISGAVPVPHEPVANLSIDLTAPARAYDHIGQRIFFGTDQVVDCSVDHTGIPTDVASAGNERWLGVFLRFDRRLSDERTDGNSQRVFFRRDESFAIIVRQTPEAAEGSASRVSLVDDELLVCDVRRRAGQTQIASADIDTTRRQAFVFADGRAVETLTGLWRLLQPAEATVQSALDEVDAELDGHFGGTDRRHIAAGVDFTPSGFVGATNVQAAIAEIASDLASSSPGRGATYVGTAEVPGTPHGLGPGNVALALNQLLYWLNEHLGALTAAHPANAIAATPHNYLTTLNVQAQLEELIGVLATQTAAHGSAHIGSAAIGGSPHNLTAGTVRDQLSALLAALNIHDHDGRYYNEGEQVADADTVDGQHAADFALAGHDHDDRYLRRSFYQGGPFNADSLQRLTTLTERPDVIAVTYNHVNEDGLPQATSYVRGEHTDKIRVWVTKSEADGDKEYELWVQNTALTELYIMVSVYSATAE